MQRRSERSIATAFESVSWNLMDFADAKTLDVAGGCREIMRNVIVDQLLDD